MPEPKFNREDHLENKTSSLSDLTGHLDDLRWTILYSVIALIVGFVLAFYYSGELITLLERLAPQGSSFFQLKPGELFTVSLKVSFFAALYFSVWVIIWQIYAFLKPALKPDENELACLIAVLAPLLFYIGLVFAYEFLLPPLLEFLLNFRDGVVEKRYGLESFVNLVLSIETVTGIAFQLPVVIFILGLLNLVTVKALFKIWRYVVLFAFVISALITPTPDPLTMSILAIALLLLYFSTILLLKLMGK